jgi:sec-independent protein translocase protein TatA
MHLGIWEILIIVLVVVLLFGRGKISDLMGDVAKGIKNFKKGMSDDTAQTPPSPPASDQARVVDATVQPPAPNATPSAQQTAAPNSVPEKKAG